MRKTSKIMMILTVLGVTAAIPATFIDSSNIFIPAVQAANVSLGTNTDSGQTKPKPPEYEERKDTALDDGLGNKWHGPVVPVLPDNTNNVLQKPNLDNKLDQVFDQVFDKNNTNGSNNTTGSNGSAAINTGGAKEKPISETMDLPALDGNLKKLKMNKGSGEILVPEE